MANPLDQIKELDSRFLSAAANGMVSAIQGAVVGGADKQAVNDKGQGALHLAIEGNHFEAVQYLCETAKLDVNARDHDGNTPLLTAFTYGRGEIAEYLVQQQQADTSICDKNGQGIVWKAAENRTAFGEKLMKIAVSHAENLDEINHAGHTPIHTMVERANLTGLHVALLAGANPNLKGEAASMSPLQIAEADNLYTVQQMLEPFAKLPQTLDIASLTHDKLMAENTEGKRLLDNPVLWRQMPQVLDVLESKGEPLPSKEELTVGGIMGYPPLAIAVFSGQFAAAERCMASHSEQVTAEDYWNHDHSMVGMFGKAAIETGLLQAQFTPEHAEKQGIEATRALYNALPPEGREAVPNYRQLMLRLSQQEQTTGRGR